MVFYRKSKIIRCISYYGPIGTHGVTVTMKVRPALFLKTNVSIASGDGSSDNPFKLTM